MLISITDIIKKTLLLYRDNARLFLAYSALMFVPTILTVGALAPVVLYIKPYNAILAAVAYIVLALVFAVVGFWISMSFIRAIAARTNGASAKKITEEMLAAKSAVWPALLASVLAGLAVVLGVILLIIPAVLFGIWFAFSIHAVVLDGKKPVEALKYSKSLAAGRWWQVLWRLLLPGILFTVFALALDWTIGFPFDALLEGMVQGSIEFTIVSIVSLLLSSVINIAVTPLSTTLPTILYLELKKTPADRPALPAPADK